MDISANDAIAAADSDYRFYNLAMEHNSLELLLSDN